MSFLGGYLLPFLIVLSILVFFHELGHYLVAKWCKVRVDVFSIGFGPEIFGFHDKAGTRWRFSLIPLGGYVKMAGDADVSSRPNTKGYETLSEEKKKDTLQSKSVSQRIAISAAGPIANFILAIVFLMGLFIFKGEPIQTTTIGVVQENGIAARAGVQVGDRVLAFNGEEVDDFYQLAGLIRLHGKKNHTALIQRGDEKITLTFTPQEGEKSLWGIQPGAPEYRPVSPLKSFKNAVIVTYEMSANLLSGLKAMIMGDRSSGELGGIIAIGDMAGQSVQQGLSTTLWFMAILSINLGMINLLPIPVLDGGNIVLYVLEGIKGKPLSQRFQDVFVFTGFAAVMTLMIVATWNDLMRYKVVSWVANLFQ
jgi:regulator of sigma E protease